MRLCHACCQLERRNLLYIQYLLHQQLHPELHPRTKLAPGKTPHLYHSFKIARLTAE